MHWSRRGFDTHPSRFFLSFRFNSLLEHITKYYRSDRVYGLSTLACVFFFVFFSQTCPFSVQKVYFAHFNFADCCAANAGILHLIFANYCQPQKKTGKLTCPQNFPGLQYIHRRLHCSLALRAFCPQGERTVPCLLPLLLHAPLQ